MMVMTIVCASSGVICTSSPLPKDAAHEHGAGKVTYGRSEGVEDTLKTACQSSMLSKGNNITILLLSASFLPADHQYIHFQFYMSRELIM